MFVLDYTLLKKVYVMEFFLFKYKLPAKKFAADLRISLSYLYQLLKKEKKPSLELALKIEQYTQGEVTVGQLLGKEKAFEVSEKLVSFHNKNNIKLESINIKLQSIERRLIRFNEKLKKLEEAIIINPLTRKE